MGKEMSFPLICINHKIHGLVQDYSISISNGDTAVLH